MFRKRNFFLILSCGVVIFLILTFASINLLTKWEMLRYNTVETTFEENIWKLYHAMPTNNYKRVDDDLNGTNLFLKNILVDNGSNLTNLWKYVNNMITKDALYPQNDYLGTLIKALQTAKIIKGDLDRRGTQLKLILILDGGQKVIFKPKWYHINKVIEGPVYAGKDRYVSEILAFYLSGLLRKPLVPVAVLRKINFNKDILPVATNELLSTTFHHKNSTCFYGKCFYCKKEDPICTNSKGFLTGAVIFNLNVELKNHRSPWQRTYKSNKKAIWEVQDNYCNIVKGKLSKNRLYDLIDTAIFDFLIQNGDRHHYETYEDRVLLLDNGKGLGNPHVHHTDILAPLYQCCLLRKNTWKRLQYLGNGKLKKLIKSIPNIDRITTDEHIDALEIRLKLIYAVVEYCKLSTIV